MMNSKVAQFEQSVRRMLENVLYHDDARKLLLLIEAVAKQDKLSGADLRDELRTKAFLLILKLDKHKNGELVNPLLCDLANVSSIHGFIIKVVNDLMPVVTKLNSDPCKPDGDRRPSCAPSPPSSSPPPGSCT